MKKVNKALMSTVAILLSLVLISTSVLSGVFAKFVDTKSAGATVSLKAFGLTLTVNKGSDVPSTAIVTPSTIDANTLSVTVTDFKINASTTKYNSIIWFTISKTTPNVDKVKLILSIEVSGVDSFYFAGTNDGDNDEIPAGNHIPLAFTTRILPDTTNRISTTDYYWCCPLNDDDLEDMYINGIEKDIVDNITAYKTSNTNKYDIAVNNRALEVVIWDKDKGTDLTITDIRFGYRPYANSTTGVNDLKPEEASLLQAYLMEQNPSLTITYTVSLEQVID